MGNEPESPENLVARRIREQLGQGRLDKLIQAQEVLKIFTQGIQLEGIPSEEAFGTPHVGGGSISAVLQPPQAHLEGRVSEYKLRQIADAMGVADPELANEVQIRGPRDAMVMINYFNALMALIQAALTVYQIVHGAPPPPERIVQIFNNTTNWVIQAPPAHD